MWPEKASPMTVGIQMSVTSIESQYIAYMYYNDHMMSGDLIKEARLRAGLTQTELGARLAKAQSVIAR